MEINSLKEEIEKKKSFLKNNRPKKPNLFYLKISFLYLIYFLSLTVVFSVIMGVLLGINLIPINREILTILTGVSVIIFIITLFLIYLPSVIEYKTPIPSFLLKMVKLNVFYDESEKFNNELEELQELEESLNTIQRALNEK